MTVHVMTDEPVSEDAAEADIEVVGTVQPACAADVAASTSVSPLHLAVWLLS